MPRKNMSGENNPFYGKKHDSEAKKKMSQKRPSMVGENNPFAKSLLDPKKREAHRTRCKEVWAKRSKEWREKFAQKVSRGNVENGNVSGKHHHHKSGHYPSIKGGDVYYRSLWELYVIEQLDYISLVYSFLMESEVVQYTTEKGNLRYSKPDFLVTLVDGSVVLIEVKPKGLVGYNSNAQKFEAYRQRCSENGWNFLLITKDNLFEVEQCLLNI